VIYLDSDDEITSAAARIRALEGRRVAVVLPYGSRVATSRINFRLLARDAQSNGKDLAIVAGDAATRALAASAGLAVFGTVHEYESVTAGAEDPGDAAGERAPDERPTAPIGEGPIDGALISETVATPRPKAAGTERGGAPRRPRAGDPAAPGDGPGLWADGTDGDPEADPTDPRGPADASAAGAAASLAAEPATDPARPRPEHARRPSGIPAARVVADTPDLDRPRASVGPVARPRPLLGRWRASLGRTPVVLGAAVVALALVVSAVGAYVFLPTATAVITPRTETIGPIALRIVADPDATEPDVANAVVPAERLTIEISATDTFPATGKRVEETKATGRVRFDNLNPTGSNTIPKGSVVSTNGSVRFRTDEAVRIPAAELVGLTIVPSRATVAVTAVDAGPEGNVEPNAITTIPRGEEPIFLKVTNPDATGGGKRDEFPRITQEDVDAAVAALTDQLTAGFDVRLADPDLPGDTATVFPETKALGEPSFSADPASFVGQEIETFELGATAQGTVVAVDTAPVRVVAEATIQSSVEPGFDLVAGSSEVLDAPALIDGGRITFPVTVTAQQVLVLDPAEIEAAIIGKSLADARAILATYGAADLQVWPDWVGTIPTFDSRVEVVAAEPASSGGDGPDPGASPEASP
jgi:hypothetical protein